MDTIDIENVNSTTAPSILQIDPGTLEQSSPMEVHYEQHAPVPAVDSKSTLLTHLDDLLDFVAKGDRS